MEALIEQNTVDRESFAASGFLVLPGVLRAEEVHDLRAAVMETLDRVARALLAPFETSCPGEPLEDRLEKASRKDRAYANVLLQAVLADAQRDPRIAVLEKHGDLAARLRDLLHPLTVTGHAIRVRASLPSLAVHRSPWHQDVTELPATGAQPTGCQTVRLACWTPLSDADENTGALEVLPGGRTSPLPHSPVGDGRFYIPEESLPAGPRAIVPVKRGDVLVLDRFLPHRALPVRHGRARWAVVMWVKAC